MSCAERPRGHGPDGGTVSVSRLFRCVTILCLALAALFAPPYSGGYRQMKPAHGKPGTCWIPRLPRRRPASGQIASAPSACYATMFTPATLPGMRSKIPSLKFASRRRRLWGRCAVRVYSVAPETPFDKKLPVVMAAAHSLRDLKGRYSAYAIYYDVLTGARKSNDGLVAQQLETLHNPQGAGKNCFSEGHWFRPLGGHRLGRLPHYAQKRSNPVRAVAASFPRA